ncbi:MAG: hypothetical protein ACR2LN_03765 [Candidatus Levyibacteriota bacterium]
MSVETAQPGRISDTKVHTLLKDFGGSRYRHIHPGEGRDIVVVEDVTTPYIIKKTSAVPDRAFDTTRMRIPMYEAGILKLLVDHLDDAPVAIPTVIDEDPISGLFIAQYMPGITLTDGQVASMKTSEKDSLGRKLAQYVHWFSKAIPLDSSDFRQLYNSHTRSHYDKRAA